jgi:5S rRNA maturation endonuclease (ribonuclease M5)
MTALDRFRDALARHGCNPRGTAARCPAHDDHKPSLSFGPARLFDGVVVSCQLGCHLDDILAALGLGVPDLFDEPRQAKQGYAVVAEYPYRDEAGKVLYVKERRWPKDFRQYVPLPNGDRQWSLNGVRRVLYRLPEVITAIAESRTVYVVEGEKDADELVKAGKTATCNTEGAAKSDQRPKWRKEYTEQLRGAMVTVIADKDEAGRAHASHIAKELTGVAAHVRLVEPLDGKDAYDHLQAGWNANEWLEVFDQLQDEGPDQQEPPASEPGPDGDIRLLLPRIDWHELWADDGDEEWILYPLIPARRGIAMFSPAKIGKSLLMLEVAVGISRGTKVLGHTPSRRYRVLYVDFENDPRADIRTRLQDMGYGPDDLDHLDYLSFPALTDLDTEQGAARLMAAIAAYSSEVVIIDTISRAVEGEENSNDTWLAFYRYTGLKLRKAEVAMFRLDHTGKDQTKGQRGGSAKYGDVDAVWKLTKVTEERFRLECTDSRFPLDTKSLSLKRLADPLRHEVKESSAATEREAKIALIVKEADEAGLPAGMSVRDLREWGKGRGIKARMEIWTEAVRQRTITNPEDLFDES